MEMQNSFCACEEFVFACRANRSYEYGSYGVCGNIGWNTTPEDIEIEMSTGVKVVIPGYGWIQIKS